MPDDPYEQFPQNRPMPHPGSPRWQDLASQGFLETTDGTKEYWQKQAKMWKQNFGELFRELEDTRARSEGAESEVREILKALKSHCKDDFVVVEDGAINWRQTVAEFVGFITQGLHDKYAHEGGKPQIMTADILKQWIASIDVPIMTDIYQTKVPNVFYATFALPLYEEHYAQLRALGIEVTYPNSTLRNRYMLKWLTPQNDEY